MGRWEAEPIIPREEPIPLGIRIRARRRALGLTLDEVATAVGCRPAHLSALELGKRNPSPPVLQGITSALRFQTPEELLAASQDEIIGWLNSRDTTVGKGRHQTRQRPKTPIALEQLPLPEPHSVLTSESLRNLEAIERINEIVEIMKDPNIPSQVKNALVKSVANLIELAKTIKGTATSDTPIGESSGKNEGTIN